MRPRETSDATILSTARACFLEHGAGVSTATIAERLGISQSALFKRFGTKEELLRRSLCVPAPPWVAGFLDAGPDPERGLKEQLVEFGEILDRFFEQATPYIAVLRSSGLSPKDLFEDANNSPPARGQRAFSAWLARAHAAGMAHVEDPDAVALAFLGSIQIRPYLNHAVGLSFRKDDGESYARHIAELFWAGIAPKENEA